MCRFSLAQKYLINSEVLICSTWASPSFMGQRIFCLRLHLYRRLLVYKMHTRGGNWNICLSFYSWQSKQKTSYVMRKISCRENRFHIVCVSPWTSCTGTRLWYTSAKNLLGGEVEYVMRKFYRGFRLRWRGGSVGLVYPCISNKAFWIYGSFEDKGLLIPQSSSMAHLGLDADSVHFWSGISCLGLEKGIHALGWILFYHVSLRSEEREGNSE